MKKIILAAQLSILTLILLLGLSYSLNIDNYESVAADDDIPHIMSIVKNA